MTGDRDRAVGRLLCAYRQGRTLAVLLDYDGTLAPIQEHPRLAVLSADASQALAGLAALPRVCVGIVSGRSLDDLMSMVGLPGMAYVGSSGLEYDVNGTRFTPCDAQQVGERLASLKQKLAQVLPSFPGAWLESKPLGVTLHFRETAVQRLTELRVRTRSVLEAFAADLCVCDGPMSLEITPDVGWNKGTAVRWLCKQFGYDALPLYAGDHANDADALAAAASLDGLSLGVGPDAPRSAEYRLEGPEALLSLLGRLSVGLTHVE